MLKGIDVSTHQGYGVDWERLKDEISFAIIRCGYGMDQTNQDDGTFKRNVEECIRLGIPFGVYLYSYADSTYKANSEADHVLRLVNPYKDKISLGVWYDVEDKKQLGISNSLLGDIIDTFCGRIAENGYKVGIYSYNAFLNSKVEGYIKDKYPIWSAGFGKNDGEPHESAKYNHDNVVMWQYTSAGHVDGVDGNCDMNYYLSDDLNLPYTPESEDNSSNDNDIHHDGKLNCVWDVQEWLGVGKDNIVGPITLKALRKRYQHELNVQFKAGIAEDGIIGPATLNATRNIKRGMQGNITKIIQCALICCAYDLVADGIFGGATESDVKDFQASHSLSADGIVGKNTIKALL